MLCSPGLSPRLRGNHDRLGSEIDDIRSIPAPAGEPTAHVVFPDVIQVYPRACGGTGGLRHRGSYSRGLSPRLRGNLLLLHKPRCAGRSIPAPAGEPSTLNGPTSRFTVYPRACGGTGAIHAGYEPR